MVAGLQALKGRGQVSDEELLALIAKRLRRRYEPPACPSKIPLASEGPSTQAVQ
jgi:hypothetical protein